MENNIEQNMERIVRSVMQRNGLVACFKGEKVRISPYFHGMITVFISNNVFRDSENISKKLQMEVLAILLEGYNDLHICKDDEGWLFIVHE